jgi:hypothetical protein
MLCAKLCSSTKASGQTFFKISSLARTLPGLLHKVQQHVEGPGVERDDRFFPPHSACTGINLKFSELEYFP